MKPFKKRKRTENESVLPGIRRVLSSAGFATVKLHGSRHQAGLPDLACLCRSSGRFVWVEAKRPGSGRLTPAQRKRFPELEADGWLIVVCDQPEAVLELIANGSNWRAWL